MTPFVPPFVDILNKIAAAGYARWEVGARQSIFGKSFAPDESPDSARARPSHVVMAHEDVADRRITQKPT